MGGKKAILVWMQEEEAQFWEAEADVWPQ